MAPLRILHFVSDIDEKHGGPAQSVPRLVAALNDLGCSNAIVHVGHDDARNDVVSTKGLEVHRVPAWLPQSLALAPSMKSKLAAMSAERRFDVVHIHSMWRLSAMSVFHFARANGMPHVVSPRSNLYQSSLNRSTARKALAKAAFVEDMLASAAFIHATEDGEAEAVQKLGYSPTVTIPNGLDLPETVEVRTFRKPGSRHFLFLSRVHPRKRPELLIEAFREIAAADPEVQLTFAGPCDSESYLAELKAKGGAMVAKGQVRFVGMLRGQYKEAAFDDADIFVLPSDFENFGIAVGEALARGLPVITTEGTPWRFLDGSGGWIIPVGSAPQLQNALAQANAADIQQLQSYSAVARDTSARYRWPDIASRMRDAYVSAVTEG